MCESGAVSGVRQAQNAMEIAGMYVGNVYQTEPMDGHSNNPPPALPPGCRVHAGLRPCIQY